MRKEFKVDGIEKLNPNDFGGMCSRAIALERKTINFDEGITTVATTEAPALVVDWERWQVVREILPMRYCELPANDKVPLLDSHSRWSIEQIKGSAVEWSMDGANLMCKTVVSASEPVVRQKISEGHIDSVSIGYMTDKNYTVEVPKGASVTVDGVQYKNEYEDSYPLLVRTWWKTHELSLVPIGADEAAKFKSAAGLENKKLFDEIESLRKEVSELKPKGKDKAQFERRLRLIKTKI